MQKLTFINSRGSLDLTSGNYGITNWSGFSDTPIDVQTQTVPFQDGTVYLDSLLQERTISITVAFDDKKDLKKRYELKRELISYLNPKLGEGVLIYENDFLKKQINAIPNLPIFENKNADVGGTNKVSVSFECCSPYWEDIEETSITLNNGSITNVLAEGDYETNCIIDIIKKGSNSGSDLENSSKIENLSNNKSIKINGLIDSNIEINTNLGKKSIIEGFYDLEPMSVNNSFTYIVYNELYDKFLGVTGNLILISSDGETWEVKKSESEKYSIDAINTVGDIIIYHTTQDVVFNISFDFGKTWQKSKYNSAMAGQKYQKIEFFKKKSIFAYTGYSAMISYDGINWYRTRNKYLKNIDYFERLDKFIGTTSTSFSNYNDLYISDDGLYWELLKTLDFHPNDVYCSKDKIIVIGNSGKILTSSDGINWLEVNSGVTENLNEINFINHNFVVIGNSGKILTSSDGINWLEVNNPSSKSFSSLSFIFSVNLLNKLFINIVSNGNIEGGMITTDGINYNYNPSNVISKFQYMIYADKFEKYFGCNHTTYIFTNTNYEDVNNWEQIEQSDNCSSICYSKYLGLLLKTINGARGARSILISSDGETWETVVNETEKGGFYYSTFKDSIKKFMVFGEDGIYVSGNGRDWEILEFSGGSINRGDYSYILDKYVGCNVSGSYKTLKSGKLYVSSGSEKKFVDTGIKATKCLFIDEKNIFVAVGDDGIYISSDGTTWIQKSSEKFEDVLFYKDMNSIICAGSKILISSDGETWSNVSSFEFYSRFIFDDYKNEKLLFISDVLAKYPSDTISSFDNAIYRLSEDSSLDFTLIPGNNKICTKFPDSVKVILKFKNKYIGV